MLDKIKTAEGRYSDYYKLISEIREYYRNDRKKNKQKDQKNPVPIHYGDIVAGQETRKYELQQFMNSVHRG